MDLGGSNEDEWEYEYSTTETETFYVDLDLSSVNGVIKSKNAGDRKTLRRLDTLNKGRLSVQTSSKSDLDQAADFPNQDDHENEEDVAADEEGENEEIVEPNSPAQAHTPGEPSLLDEDYSGRFQVLDFHTTNPIISYNGNIYSCTWHDMLGTTMFITKHQETPFHEPEISTEDYDLIGTSRIKLVGQRARVAPKAGSKKRNREEDEEDVEDDGSTRDSRTSALDGRSLGTITRTNPRTNIEIKQQASFLEKLMEIKKARGDTDSVRTFVDRRTVAADARQARKAQRKTKGKEKATEKEETKEQRLRREITELNKRVVKGDNDALERLQEIYADMEEVGDDEDEVLIAVPSATATATINDVRTTTDDTNNPRASPANEGGSGGGGVGSQVEFPHAADKDPNGASGSAALN